MMFDLITVLVAMCVIMSAAWLTQRSVNNAGWIDVFWTFGTGFTCADAALWPDADGLGARKLLVAGLVALWALRLGGYIAIRVARGPEDTRYARLREDWGGAFQQRLFLLVIAQAPATALLATSVYVAAHTSGPIGLRDWAGAATLAIAILGEALADEQMRRFKQTPGHGKIMDRGLWAWSRHPNYFLEWFGWLAYPIIGFQPENPVSYLTLIAPVLMYVILRYGTGIPALEKTMMLSRGADFAAYQQRVSAFVPRPPRRVHP